MRPDLRRAACQLATKNSTKHLFESVMAGRAWLGHFLLSAKICCQFRVNVKHGRAIAQVASHRLPTTAARLRAQVRLCGICG
jgi:hypothetical protein